MVIKVYTSGISGNKEVKKRQQRILMILESKNIEYVAIDITEPGNEEDKQFMQEHAESKGTKHAIPPQIFNESQYCGDYDGFDLANENDELETFLKLPRPPVLNGKPPPQQFTSDGIPDESLTHRLEALDQDEDENKEPGELQLQPEDETQAVSNGGGLSSQVEPEESVHGFCFTPSLAKRLEKAIKSRVVKPKPSPLGSGDEEEDEVGEGYQDEMEAEEESESQEDSPMKEETLDGGQVAQELQEE